MTSIKNFVRKTYEFTKNKVIKFWRTVADHTEAVAILTLAGFGANVLIGELPFYATLPMWIEAPMVIPVIAIFIVSGLVRTAEFRARNARRVYA